MSRIAKEPLAIPGGVEVQLDAGRLQVRGARGSLSMDLHPSVSVERGDGSLQFASRDGSKQARALAGTMRALAGNMVEGVSKGFEKRLELRGVGYRAKAAGDRLELSLGFSHPVVYRVPSGLSAQTPSQTEVVLSGSDKQLLGQAAAEIRAFRPPEPYKGKGVRYAGEHVRSKEARKK